VSGLVFHPGHHALHGMTVVLEASDGRTCVGRFDTEDEAGVHLRDVGIHRAEDGPGTRDDYLRHTLKFGVRRDVPHLVVPRGSVLRITRLTEYRLD